MTVQYRIKKLHTADTSHAVQHAAGETLAKDMLCTALGVSAEEVTFLHTDTGKPYAAGHNIHFSVSHSGDHILCAVHEAPVGADVEKIASPREKVMQRVCTPAEITYIGDDPVRFTEIWTRKEAYAKLTGKGLAIGLKTIVVADENGLFSGINGHAVLTEKLDGYVYSVVWKDDDHAT